MAEINLPIIVVVDDEKPILDSIATELDANVEFINDVGLAGLMCELGFIGLSSDLVKIPYASMNAAQLKDFKRQVYFAN